MPTDIRTPEELRNLDIERRLKSLEQKITEAKDRHEEMERSFSEEQKKARKEASERVSKALWDEIYPRSELRRRPRREKD